MARMVEAYPDRAAYNKPKDAEQAYMGVGEYKKAKGRLAQRLSSQKEEGGEDGGKGFRAQLSLSLGDEAEEMGTVYCLPHLDNWLIDLVSHPRRLRKRI